MDIWTPAAAVVGAVITAGSSYLVGRLNSRASNQTADKNAQQAFTDDVMAAMTSFKADSAELFALRMEVVELRQEKALADIREASCKQQLTDLFRVIEERDERIASLQGELKRERDVRRP